MLRLKQSQSVYLAAKNKYDVVLQRSGSAPEKLRSDLVENVGNEEERAQSGIEQAAFEALSGIAKARFQLNHAENELLAAGKPIILVKLKDIVCPKNLEQLFKRADQSVRLRQKLIELIMAIEIT